MYRQLQTPTSQLFIIQNQNRPWSRLDNRAPTSAYDTTAILHILCFAGLRSIDSFIPQLCGALEGVRAEALEDAAVEDAGAVELVQPPKALPRNVTRARMHEFSHDWMLVDHSWRLVPSPHRVGPLANLQEPEVRVDLEVPKQLAQPQPLLPQQPRAVRRAWRQAARGGAKDLTAQDETPRQHERGC